MIMKNIIDNFNRLSSRQRNSHNLQLHVKPYKSTIQTLQEIRTNVLMASHHYLEEQVY